MTPMRGALFTAGTAPSAEKAGGKAGEAGVRGATEKMTLELSKAATARIETVDPSGLGPKNTSSSGGALPNMFLSQLSSRKITLY